MHPNCRITDMVPNLVFADGTTANMNNGVLLHHFVFFNPAQALDLLRATQRALLGRRQRAHARHLPTPYGYQNTARTGRCSRTW